MKNQKKNYTYHKGGANLSVIKIDATHCFCCGINMDNTTPENVKTKHHAIPEEMKPIRNIVVPACKGCHTKLHNSQSLTNHNENKFKKRFESLEKTFNALNKNLENFKETIIKNDK